MKGLCLAASVLAAGLTLAGAETAPHRQTKFNPVSAKIDLAAARTAVVVIDMQNDFCSDGGLLDHLRMDLSEIKRTIAPTARVLAAARRAGLPIIYLQMAFKPDLSDAGPKGSPNREGHLHAGAGNPVTAPDGSASRILIRDTWDTAVIDALKPAPGDIAIYKTRFDGFYQTDLDAILKKLGVTQLVVAGITTSTCVESTIRDAMFHDYSCVLLADCTAEPLGGELPYTNYAATLFIVQARFGAVSSSAEFLEAVRRRLGPAPGR